GYQRHVACGLHNLVRVSQQGCDRRAELDRAKAIGVDAAYCDRGFTQKFVTANRALLELDRGALHASDVRVTDELVIELCRPAVLYFNAFYDEQASFGFCELRLVHTETA